MGIHHEKRGTGRTHNMIMEALEIGAMTNQNCAIVVMRDNRCIEHTLRCIVPRCFAEGHHYWRIQKQGKLVQVGERTVIKFKRADEIANRFGNDPNAPHLWAVPGYHVFVDHLVIQDAFGAILQAWSRYDNPHHKVNFHE